MSLVTILVALFNEAKVFSPVILAVGSGLGMILTKTLGWGISEIFQALAFVFSGVSAVGIKNAVAEVSAVAKGLSAPAAGTGTGTTPEAGTGTTPEAKAS